MLRVILVTLLFGSWMPCFSEESQNDYEEWQNQSLQYFVYGSAHLLSHEPWLALEDFQMAATSLGGSDRASPAITFLISFGQAIAFDVLGFTEQCKQTLGSLFLGVNAYAIKDQNAESNADRNFSDDNQYAEALDFFYDLAAIAPSLDVRELLFSFIDGISEEVLPSFAFGKAPFLEKAVWDFDYGKGDVSIMECKSWWKKFKKFCYEVLELLGIASEAYKKLNEIKDSHERFRS